jgi:hypothetical protein
VAGNPPVVEKDLVYAVNVDVNTVASLAVCATKVAVVPSHVYKPIFTVVTVAA